VLRAEEFCLQCHTNAAVGDVLGTVVVRDYLSTRLSSFWSEVQLSGALNVVKIVLHTVILFFLLRMLMRPLLSLRSSVARLARGEVGLSARAEVVSSDEFGDLAHDLNVFLDRMDQLLSDLEETISGLVEVDARLEQVAVNVADHVQRLEDEALEVGSAPLVHRAHEVRHALDEMKSLEIRMREVAGAGQRLLARLARATDSDVESAAPVIP
jgi:methyl-accepting chemotaxis protein